MIEANVTSFDFYERKIRRLEECNDTLHEEVAILHSKLRIAEDYEIKYAILLKNSDREKEKLKQFYESREKTIIQEQIRTKIKESDDAWQIKFSQFQSKLRQVSHEQLSKVKAQLDQKKHDLSNLKQRGEQIQIFTFKLKKFQRQNQSLKEQIQQMRQIYEKQRTDQISKIKLTLNTTYRQKIEAERKKYEYKIIQLETKLNQIETQKDNQSYQPSNQTNKELANVKIMLEENLELFNAEIKDFSNNISAKDAEIKRLLNEKYQFQLKHRKQLNGEKEYTKQLQEKIIEKQKEHHLQIFNLTARNNYIKDQEIQELKEEVKKLNEQMSKRNQIWNEKAEFYETQINDLNHKFQEDQKKALEQKNQHKRKISELSNKIKEAEHERQSENTHTLITTMKDLDSKEDHLNNYDNGIVFLERQLKNCQVKLQEKSRMINKLYENINSVRNETEKELSEIREKQKQDKKGNNDKVFQLQNEIKDLNDRLRVAIREQKKREKGYFNETKEFEEKIKALKQFIEELQRDYNRVVENKKDLESSYRQQKQKSFGQKTDNMLLKKAKWIQLQKQKNELMIIFREKEEQLKLNYENQLDQVIQKYTKLQKEHEILLQDHAILKKNYQKLQSQISSNKQNNKMAEYNKKMATLNLQLALTQNIYQSLIKAKSQEYSFDAQKIDKIDIQSNSSQGEIQQLQLTFNAKQNK